MKKTRHDKIIELITEYDISTQDELSALLNDAGFKTTQATVSRDIKSLGLRKVPGMSGQKYAMPEARDNEKEKYQLILKEGISGIEQAATLVVIKTIPGMAMAVAAAVDGLNFREIAGSIAGDDTIMCACRSEKDAHFLVAEFHLLLNEI